MAMTCQIGKTGKPRPNAKATQPRSSIKTHNAHMFIFPQANEWQLALWRALFAVFNYGFSTRLWGARYSLVSHL